MNKITVFEVTDWIPESDENTFICNNGHHHDDEYILDIDDMNDDDLVLWFLDVCGWIDSMAKNVEVGGDDGLITFDCCMHNMHKPLGHIIVEEF